jgi:FKBP-type peptidyl-prolyl cis-trans isomerase
MDGERRLPHSLASRRPLLALTLGAHLAFVATTTLGCHREEAASFTSTASAPVKAATLARRPRLPETPTLEIPPPPDVAAPPPSAVRTRAGFASVVLTPGTGAVHPQYFDLVEIRYVVWTKDGKTFGASDQNPKAAPTTTRVNDGGIPGLLEGLELMVAGEKRRLWVPPGFAGNATGKDLVIDVELIDIVPTPRPPPVPGDAAQPPASAHETHSGLKWRLLSSTASKNALKPNLDSIAVYNFTTWTRKGELLSSSLPKGAPVSRNVSLMDAPFSEIVQLMRVGDSVRVWFGQNQGAPPGGPYVADVDLIYVYPLAASGQR